MGTKGGCESYGEVWEIRERVEGEGVRAKRRCG